MYFINHNIIKNQIAPDTLIHILTIPYEERSMHDHQLAFRYLIANPQLIEVERVKSLNARLQIVAFLQVFQTFPAQYEDCYHLIQKVKISKEMDEKKKLRIKRQKGLKDEQLANLKQILIYTVCIKKDKYESILNADERYLRKNMEMLKNYSLLKNMQYSKMLHLSYHMEIVSYKYKDYVYREGENSDFVYFVEQGEFNFEKSVAENEEDIRKQKELRKSNKKKKNLGQGSIGKRYEVGVEDNPNRLRKSKSKDFRIGSVQGGHGQCFGDEELITDKKREYSVRCDSTENCVIKIHKNFFKNVTFTPTTINWLKTQNKQKLLAKKEVHEKIISTKNNYKKYAKMIEKSDLLNKTQKVRSIKEEENKFSIDELKSKLMAIQEEPSKLSNKKSVGYLAINHVRKSVQIPPSQSEAFNKNKKSIHASEHTEEDENVDNIFNQTFTLTKANTDNVRKIKKKKTAKSVHQNSRQDSDSSAVNSSLLPSLYTKPSLVKKQASNNTIEALIGHNWSASRPNIELKGMRNKYSGMVDSNFLIKQKQYILERRNNRQIARQEIFPFELDEKAKKQIEKHTLVQRKETREMRSAVHSKDYMQRLLIDALKKAGYNTEKSSPEKEKSNLHFIGAKDEEIDIKTNMRVPKQLKQRLKNMKTNWKSQEEVLEENSFDQCYFSPI